MIKKKCKRKLPVMLVALLFAATSSGVIASNITGVDGVGGVFNIDPAKNVGDVGFRGYQNFTLDKGDTANLRFNGINTFVNMVDNQININGVVNTVNGSGGFYNGHAVFVSPKGMVVGQSGVLNVGSLSAYTPTPQGMKMLKKGVENGSLTTTYQGKEINLLDAMGWHGNAPITVNGQVYARNNVTMVANKFNMGQTGAIAAGVAGIPDDALFSSLVKTNNNAKIDIRAYDRNGGGGVNIAGDLRNYGKGNIEIINRGASGLVNTGNIQVENGQLHLVNAAGQMNIGGTVQGNGDNVYLTNGPTGGKMIVSGNITGNAGTRIWNRSVSGAEIGGKIVNSGKGLAITNEQGELNFTGSIKNTNANMNIMNTGSKLVLNNIESSGGKIVISSNGNNGMTLNGTIKNNGNTAITNYNGKMTVNGTVQNTSGKMNLTNKGEGGLYLANGSKILSNGTEVLIQNTGAGGFNMNGNIDSSAATYLQNTKGDLNIAGDITGHKRVVYLGNRGNGGLNINGDITTNGSLQINNSGDKGITMDGVVYNNGGDTAIANRGAGNLTLNGVVRSTQGNINLNNAGEGALNITQNAYVCVDANGATISLYNTGKGGMNLDGKVENNSTVLASVLDDKFKQSKFDKDDFSEAEIIKANKGKILITNKNGDLNINGEVKGTNSNVNISNSGNGALNINENANIHVKGADTKLSLLNTGKGGMNINGTVRHSTGQTLITNKNGDLNVNALVDNAGGRLYLNNSGNGALNITQKGELSNGGLGRTYITNSGAGGMNIDGVVAGGGHIIVTNKAGGMNITSKVTSTKSNVVLTNTGDEDMVISGTVRGNKVTAYAKGNDIVLGNKNTKQIAINGLKKVSITVEDGSIKNAGVDTHLIKSGGNLYMEAKNGTIGEDVDTSGVGAKSRDLTKSINVYVVGRVKAFTTDKDNKGVINIASKGKDLNVDRIKADGKVILLTDKYTDENGVVHTGSILNAGTQLNDYANVKGTSVHLMSSGSIGTANNALHFRQTDANQKSNVVAAKDVYLHARGENNEKVNFGVIKSKEGSINVNLIKDGVVDNAIAPGKINITSRRQADKPNLQVKNVSHNPNVIKDYFDFEVSDNNGYKPFNPGIVYPDLPLVPVEPIFPIDVKK